MPRQPDGTYTLPNADVAPGDDVSSAWANSTMNDLAGALTDSLDRDGNGGMRSPLLFGDGEEAVPGIAWSNEPSSGLYRPNAGTIGISILGADVIRVAAAGTTFTGLVTADTISVGTLNTSTGTITALSIEAATITSTGDITATGVISTQNIDVTGVATIADLNTTGAITYNSSVIEYTTPVTSISISAANGQIQKWTLFYSAVLTDDLVDGQEIWIAFDTSIGYNNAGGTVTWPPARWGPGGAPQPQDGTTVKLYKIDGTLYGFSEQTSF